MSTKYKWKWKKTSCSYKRKSGEKTNKRHLLSWNYMFCVFPGMMNSVKNMSNMSNLYNVKGIKEYASYHGMEKKEKLYISCFMSENVWRSYMKTSLWRKNNKLVNLCQFHLFRPIIGIHAWKREETLISSNICQVVLYFH